MMKLAKQSMSGKLLIALALISGVALTAYGLSNLPWPSSLPWTDKDTLIKYLEFLLGTAVAIGVLAKWQRGNVVAAFSIAVAAIAITSGAVWPLLVAIGLAVSSTLLGDWILRTLKLEAESRLNCFLIGVGAFGSAVGLLAHFPANYPGVYGIALAMPLLLGRETLKRWINEVQVWYRTGSSESDYGNYGLDLAIAVVAIVYVVVALMPEVGHDALTVHLFIPEHLAQRHQWGFDADIYAWAVMPALGDWIFSIANMLGGESAARLTNVLFIFVLSWLLKDIVLWAGGTIFGARWAVLLCLSSPFTFAEGNSLFIDSIWSSLTIAGMLAVINACTRNEQQKRQFVIAGIVFGFAVAAKAVTFTLLPLMVLLMILSSRYWFKRSSLGEIVLGLASFTAIGCIPYVTAWKLTGNPLFPLFNQIFHSPLWPYINMEDLRWGKGLTWDFIYKATFQTDKYLEAMPGTAGFQWLLILIPSLAVLIAVWHKRGIALAIFAVLSIVLCFHSTAYLRYIFPAYIVLLSVMGVGISIIACTSVIQSRLLYALSAAAVVLNLIFLSAGFYVYRDFPIETILSNNAREEFLESRLPIRNAVKLVNALNINRTPVAVVGTPQTAGLTADGLYAHWYNYKWVREYAAAQTKEDMVDLLAKSHVEYIIADAKMQEFKMQRELLNQVSTKIAEFGSVSVSRLNDDFLFKKELLKNPDFVSVEGWRLNGNASFVPEAREVVVSVNSPAVQNVEVSAGRRYRNTVVARCQKEITQGRVQINWQNAKGEFIQPDIKLFTCTSDWQEVTMEVSAPKKATGAEVYAGGHTDIPIVFKSVSLRQ